MPEKNTLHSRTNELAQLIDVSGIHSAWLSLLRTHAHNAGNQFNYVASSTELSAGNILNTDLLSGLTVGEIGVLYEFSLSYADNDSRKSSGQFFTPDDMSALLAQMASRLPEGNWLDPCSGVGNLSWHLASIQTDPEQFILDKLKVSDRDSLALLIARVIFTVSFQREYTNLFELLAPNFIVFDFLSVASKSRETDKVLSDAIPVHDYVLMNPPYVSKVHDDRFETSDCRDLYGFFMENAAKTSKGFVSITPQSFTHSLRFRKLRKLIVERFNEISVVSFDNIPDGVFETVKFGSANTNKKNSTRACILVALESETASHKSTSLLRWKRAERAKMISLDNIDLSFADVKHTADIFPKVGSVFSGVYADSLGFPVLGDMLSVKATDYPLYIPSSPRYFISALKNPVQRNSIKTVFFDNEADRDYAYILLNSSVFHWWWRVVDDGMTLSLAAIRSCPQFVFTVDTGLTETLEQSEVLNKVFAKNAGKVQENVKHPVSLLERLNSLVVPDHVSSILATHGNSDIVLAD